MRKEYEMTDEQHSKLLKACAPVPYIAVTGGVEPQSPQENANAWWNILGRELGFDGTTAKPSSKGERWFTAEVTHE